MITKQLGYRVSKLALFCLIGGICLASQALYGQSCTPCLKETKTTSATKTKCGEEPFVYGSSKARPRFKQYDEHVHYEAADSWSETPCSGGTGTGSGWYSFLEDWYCTVKYDKVTCQTTNILSGSGQKHEHKTDNCGGIVHFSDSDSSQTIVYTNGDWYWFGSTTEQTESIPLHVDPYVIPGTPGFFSTYIDFTNLTERIQYFTPPTPGNYSYIREKLDFEYTDVELLGVIIGLMPDYPATWDSGGVANSEITEDHLVGTAQKMKYRFGIPDSEYKVEYKIDYERVTSSNGVVIGREKLVARVIGTGSTNVPAYSAEREILPPAFIPPEGFGTMSVEIANEVVSIMSGAVGPPGSGPEVPCVGCNRGLPQGASYGGPLAQFGLGLGAEGHSAGALQISSLLPTPLLASPAGLTCETNLPEVQVILDGSTLRQVMAPQTLVDIVTNTSSNYEIRFYLPGAAGQFTGGFYHPTPGTEFVVWKIENGDTSGNTYNQLKITEQRPGVTHIFFRVYDSANGGWRSIGPEQTGFTEATTAWDVANGIRELTVAVRESNEALVKQVTYKYQAYGWGEGLVETTEGTGAASQVSTRDYYSTSLPNGITPLKSVIHADGSWEYYVYDSSTGRKTDTYCGVLEQSTPGTQGGRHIVYNYDGLPNSGDQGLQEPFSPRTIVETLNGVEVSRSYRVVLPFERREIRCLTPNAAWDNPENQATITKRYSQGSAAMRPWTTTSPNGLLTVHNYVSTQGGETELIYQGVPNGTATGITQGTCTLIERGQLGETISETVTNFEGGAAANIMLQRWGVSQFDDFRRPLIITNLDGTSAQKSYSCCGLDWETDRNGATTSYTRDAAGRLITTTRFGVTTSNVLNAAGQVLQQFRFGVGESSPILVSQTYYDTAGQATRTTNALGGVTTFSEAIAADGKRMYTETRPDQGTIINTNHLDGTLASRTGTATFGERFEYGADSIGTFTKAIKLKGDGTDSDEWTTSYQDLLGRSIKTIYAGGTNPASYSYYNSKGQLWKEVDPDYAIRLYTYNALGEREYSVTALSTTARALTSYEALVSGLPGLLGGVDRITQNRRSVLTASGDKPHRVLRETLAWQDGQSQGTVVSAIETSTNGLKTWQITQFETGKWVTNYTVMVPGQNSSVTTIAPDGTYTITAYSYGRQTSVTRYGSTGVAIGGATYGYDTHGRQNTVADTRNGTTTYSFNNADLVSSVTTPLPGNGLSAQTTRTYYDTSLRATNVVQADGASVLTEYYPTGLRKKSYGGREYPVEYSYDYSGRLKTMTTWQGYPSTGAAVTTWNYDSQRGWLNNKRYQDAGQGSLGPDYTYTSGGRIRTRVWARGNPRVTTTYSYNLASELESIAYSDSTAGPAYAYDRLGRRKTITQAGMVTTFNYTLNGQLLSEVYAGGVLDGLSVTNGADQFGRRTNLVLLQGVSTVLARSTNSYDVAGRLATVGDGTVSSTYSYLANSPLVEQISFKQGSTPVMTTTKSYDRLNRLLSIGSTPSGSPAVQFGYSYNAANQRTRRSEADASYWVYEYDSLGQVKSGKRYWQDGIPVAGQQFEYTHDDIGNRTATKAGGDENGLNLRAASYYRNLLNQYTSRDVPGGLDVMGAALPGLTVSVNTYAPYRKGEYFRKELTAANTVVPVWQAITVVTNGQTAVTGNLWVPKTPEAFAYDIDGNLTSDGRWNYTWDAENRLVQMVANTALGPQQRLDFAYDHQGRRITKRVWNNTSGTGALVVDQKFLYDGWNLVAEFNATNNAVIRSYVWGLDLSGSLQGAGGIAGLLWIRDSSTINNQTSTHFVAHDANGNVLHLVNAADGKATTQYEYGPFGEVVRTTGPMGRANPFRFSTKYQDDETDLLYYGYRYYSASMGRWLGRDPIAEKIGLENAMQGRNYAQRRRIAQQSTHPEYVFVINRAISLVDNDGRTIAVIVGIGAGLVCLDVAACWSGVRLDLFLARSEGNDLAPDRSLHHNQGSQADALVHCIAGCNAAKHPLACLTAERALAYLNSREDPANPPGAMDMSNNTAGYGLAMNPQNGGTACGTLCLQALMNNGLFTFNNTGSIPLIFVDH